MWQDLPRILAELITDYQKLKQLNEEKRGVLVLVKLQELERLVRQEEEVVSAIHRTEKKRQELLGRMAKSGIRVSPDMQMDSVWSQCPERQQRETLYKLHRMLGRLVDEVQEAVANNGILVASALDAVNFRLNQLGGSMVEPAYGSRGQEQVSHIKNFDLEV